MWVLKRHDICPPGSFPYVQTQGIQKKFEATSDIPSQAHAVADFRKGNGLERATVQEAALDIDIFTCERLGRMKEYCMEIGEGKHYVTPVSVPVKGCGSCGANIA